MSYEVISNVRRATVSDCECCLLVSYPLSNSRIQVILRLNWVISQVVEVASKNCLVHRVSPSKWRRRCHRCRPEVPEQRLVCRPRGDVHRLDHLDDRVHRRRHLVGDGAYAVLELGLTCQANQVTLIAPLRLDARLFEPPCRPLEKRKGRPPLVGARLPNLANVIAAPMTQWHRSRVAWYGATPAVMDWTTGTALWYSTGTPPLAIRWVLVRDPQGIYPTRAFFSTNPHLAPSTIIAGFVARWSLEVTYEESRAHLGIETQRQWSDLAIERTTPALFGLFSLVVLMANALYPDGDLPCIQAAWYPKSSATFHDLLHSVRKTLWLHFLFQTGDLSPDLRKTTPAPFEHLLSAVCY